MTFDGALLASSLPLLLLGFEHPHVNHEIIMQVIIELQSL